MSEEMSEEDKKQLQELYSKKYEMISREICMDTELGADVCQNLLKKELQRVEQLVINSLTLNLYLDDWTRNFKDNLRANYIPEDAPWFNQALDLKGTVIIVGAGPSLTDEQIEMLKEYKGHIVCVNKSLKRLLEMEVIPDIVVAVHSTTEIVPHFDNPVVHQDGNKTRYLLCTNIHPDVPKVLFEKCGCTKENILWFHADTPEELIPNFNKMCQVMSNLPVIDTGGNVGLMGIQVAQICGAKTIGLLGMEHCIPLSEKWTNADAQDYNIIYAPEDDLIFALTPVMRGYLQVLHNWYMNNRKNFVTYNLTPGGLFYVRRRMEGKAMPYLDLEEFIKQYG